MEQVNMHSDIDFKESTVKHTPGKIPVIVTYDISDNKKRYKIDKTLKAFGFRVQRSVFEAFLNEFSIAKLKALLKKFADDNDSIKIYALSVNSKISELGKGCFEAQPPDIIFSKKPLSIVI